MCLWPPPPYRQHRRRRYSADRPGAGLPTRSRLQSDSPGRPCASGDAGSADVHVVSRCWRIASGRTADLSFHGPGSGRCRFCSTPAHESAVIGPAIRPATGVDQCVRGDRAFMIRVAAGKSRGLPRHAARPGPTPDGIAARAWFRRRGQLGVSQCPTRPIARHLTPYRRVVAGSAGWPGKLLSPLPAAISRHAGPTVSPTPAALSRPGGGGAAGATRPPRVQCRAVRARSSVPLVCGPASPSTTSRWAAWKCMVASLVCRPNRPSTTRW